MTERWLPERKDVKAALRALGMSNRQVDAFGRGGWKALIGATEAENADLQDKIEQLQVNLKEKQ